MEMATRHERRRFAADIGLSLETATLVVALADKAARCNERECNGDPHPKNPDRADKNRNAELWGADLEAVAAELAALVAPAGLTVEFTGLRPCLRDAAGRFIEIPH
jgi:hypothetical protein